MHFNVWRKASVLLIAGWAVPAFATQGTPEMSAEALEALKAAQQKLAESAGARAPAELARRLESLERQLSAERVHDQRAEQRIAQLEAELARTKMDVQKVAAPPSPAPGATAAPPSPAAAPSAAPPAAAPVASADPRPAALPLHYVGRDGWEIWLPANFRVRTDGHRVRFFGPGEVEVTVGAWSTRDGAARSVQARVAGVIARRYGRAYRPVGAGEGRLGPLPASLWAFDLGSRRCLDFSADHGGRSYSTMLSAPRRIANRERSTLAAIAASFVPPGGLAAR